MNEHLQRSIKLLSYVYNEYELGDFLPTELESKLGFTADEMTQAVKYLVDTGLAKQLTFGGTMILTKFGRMRAAHI